MQRLPQLYSFPTRPNPPCLLHWISSNSPQKTEPPSSSPSLLLSAMFYSSDPSNFVSFLPSPFSPSTHSCYALWLPLQAYLIPDLLAATSSSITHQCSAASTPLIPPSSSCYPIPNSQKGTSPCIPCTIRASPSSEEDKIRPLHQWGGWISTDQTLWDSHTMHSYRTNSCGHPLFGYSATSFSCSAALAGHFSLPFILVLSFFVTFLVSYC